MKLFAKKFVVVLLTMGMTLSLATGCSGGNKEAKKEDAGAGTPAASAKSTDAEKPVEFTISYSDNATLPFDPNWLVVKEMEGSVNAKINWEVIPISDYFEKMKIALNSGKAPDVIGYADASNGAYATFGLNGALVPMNKHEDWTPNFVKMRDKLGLQEDVKQAALMDGNLYYLPSLYDKPFYDCGPIIRMDLLKKYNLEVPKTYDDMYKVLKVFKEKNPDSYPVTMLVEPRVLFRMTTEAFGVDVGKNSSTGAYVLSYDREKKEYFPAMISDKYKEYLKYWNKLYKEGLLDPEFKNTGDSFTTKLATGKSMVTWAYYDQIGGLEGNSTIEGLDFQMVEPLQGPAGAFNQNKSRLGVGIAFPATTAKRPDFEQIVRAADEMFYGEHTSEVASIGKEGVTYTKDGDKIKYVDEFANSPDGIYKSMQLKHGCGADPIQKVWKIDNELTKYDDYYKQINEKVAEMGGILPVPPLPKLDDVKAEEASLLQAPLVDMFEVWTNDFITGQKDLDKDWETYVSEAKTKDIEKLAEIYNSGLTK
ncbi:MAG: extracellular solute-binding protein [Cellulosilyticaceae bacterium]